MSWKAKCAGICLTAALVAPAMPARAAEADDHEIGWAEAVWQAVTDLLSIASTESSLEGEPSGELGVAMSIEPSG